MTVNVENAGVVNREGYTDVLREIQKEGYCPFCPENLLRTHTEPITYKGKYWVVTPNFKPYEGAHYHFLVIANRHVASIQELTTEEWYDFLKCYEEVIQQFEIPGATLLWRSGDTTYTGASVEHLHAHIIVGGSGGPGVPTIRPVAGFQKS